MNTSAPESTQPRPKRERPVIAIDGPAGAGKSTMVNLIAAFADPSKGSIHIDGKDISRLTLDSYRSQLGMVLQDTFLFSGSIKDNILFGRPNANHAEVLEAARLSRVDEFAERFAHGYDTIIGERGVKLSGGQRQRISIARALIASPRILILDEATSNLDTENESYIQDALSSLMTGRTTFTIAHRLSTIRCATQILLIEDGRIVERGSHNALMQKGGRYSQLYSAQASSSQIFLFDDQRILHAQRD